MVACDLFMAWSCSVRVAASSRRFFTASACTESCLWASTSEGSLLTYNLPCLTLQANIVLYSSLAILVPLDHVCMLSVGAIKEEAKEGTNESQALLVWKPVSF